MKISTMSEGPSAAHFRAHCGFSFLALVGALFLTIAPVGPARALDPQRSLSQAFHRVWQVPQGLPQATVYSILQSVDGYIWLGTPTGLVRFDGIRFTTIPECAGLPPERLRIRDLCEDHAQNLWIATDGTGLIRYRGEKDLRYTRESGLPSDSVQCVMTMRDGSVWAGTDKGLVRLGEKLTVFGAAQGMPIEDVRAMTQAKDGTIWVAGAGNQICSFDGEKWTTHSLHALSAQSGAHAMVFGKEGAIWIGTNAGLIRYADGHETLLTVKDGLPDDSVYCLFQGADDTLWVGTRNGFSRYYRGEFANFDAADGLSQSNVYAIYEDREKSLWVGTKHGLNEFNDRRTVPFTVREGLPSNNIGALCNDSAGGIWVGTLGAGLSHFDGRHFQTFTSRDGLASNMVRALAQDSSGQIWLGSDHGIDHLEDGHVVKNFTVADGLPSNDITALCVTPAGNLWAGTPAGAVHLRGDRFVPPEGDDAITRLAVQSLLALSDGTLLVGTTGGLLQVVDEQIQRHPNAELSALEVDTMYQGPAGRIFLGTAGHGLWLIDGQRVSHFTTRDGLLDDELLGLLIDDADRVWMASGSGLSYTPRLELVNFDPRRSAQLMTTPFRLTDATRAFEVQEGVQPCILKSADGRIWQSTSRGLIMVDPSRLVRVLPPMPVVIEEFFVNGQPHDLRTLHTLKPGMSNVSFEYTALSLVVPMRITFRYKLQGFDRDWVDAGTRREAFYTNLPPGDYQFLIAARTSEEANWEVGQPLTFTILPHFYQTFWFLPSCAAAIGLAILGAYRLRVRTIKKQMRAVVAERSRIARELHDTLMQGFSGVTMEMQALLARLPHSQERGTLEEIIRDAANCVRDARRSVAGLRHDPTAESGLSAAIAQAARQLTETGDIRLRLNMRNCPRRLPVDVEYNLLRIAQEAITNSIKHSGARSIDVTLDGSGRHLLLAIEDDGAGFAGVGTPEAPVGHYGILGMRERASQIGATLRIDSEPGRGTTIRVTLPIPDMPRETRTPSESEGIAP
jgi:signal transduction histidine kinase/ligand-binding sensor domain-containing protein